MRHIVIDELLQSVLATADGKKEIVALRSAHLTASKRALMDQPAYTDGNGVTKNRVKGRFTYIDDNGPAKWTLLKDRFTAILGNKCWYTEAELVGGPLTIDHYRPKCDYWFLAFEPSNYRVACPYANSPKHNPLYGCAGGKGDNFPLLDERTKARGSKRIVRERPMILDPCNEDDCKLIAFLPDGRPVIHPDYVTDPIAVTRLERSKLLLNLDHPHFNTKRAQLHDEIKAAVEDHEGFPDGSARKVAKQQSLASKVTETAPFSIAARHYLSAYRYLDWVVEILG